MGIGGDLKTLIENDTLSIEGGLQAQIDRVKSQYGAIHHGCRSVIDSFRTLNVSGDVCLPGATGFSGDLGMPEPMGCSGDMNTFMAAGFSEAHTSLNLLASPQTWVF